MSKETERLLALEQEYSAARSTLLKDSLTEAQQKTLGEVDRKLADLAKRKEVEASRGGGIVSLALAKDDQDTAKAFTDLLPAEKFKLYEENREEWQRGLDAQEREGMRKLLG